MKIIKITLFPGLEWRTNLYGLVAFRSQRITSIFLENFKLKNFSNALARFIPFLGLRFKV